MPRYLITDSAIAGDLVTITGPLAEHLRRSLRVTAGERLLVATESGVEHGVLVEAVSDGVVSGRSLFSRAASGEPSCRVSVLQALVREMDDVVAALTHAGAAAIIPVAAERSVVRVDADRAGARRQRWEAVAREAAQLCARVRAPAIAPPAPLEAALASLPTDTRVLCCDMDAPQALAALQIEAARPLALVIGPEGSLSPAELNLLGHRGATAVHLGPRVLPARSAAAMAVTMTLMRSGDLNEPAPTPPWPR